MRTPREAAVFVYRGDCFLVMRRARERYWHVVAGVVELAESYAEAAARELREETGLEAVGHVIDLDRPQAYAVPDEMRDVYPAGTGQVVIHNFAVEAPAGWEPVLNEEHEDYRWCTLEEATALLYWPEAREAISLLADRLRSG